MGRTTGAVDYMSLCFAPDEELKAYGATLPTDTFDVLVGRGVSGTVMVSRLAPILGKRFIVTRKPAENSHTGYEYEGNVPTTDTFRWTFVDDFISSGATFMDTYRVMRERFPNAAFVGHASYTYHRWYGLDHDEMQYHLETIRAELGDYEEPTPEESAIVRQRRLVSVSPIDPVTSWKDIGYTADDMVLTAKGRGRWALEKPKPSIDQFSLTAPKSMLEYLGTDRSKSDIIKSFYSSGGTVDDDEPAF